MVDGFGDHTSDNTGDGVLQDILHSFYLWLSAWGELCHAHNTLY